MAQEPDLVVEIIGPGGLLEPRAERAVARDQRAKVGLHVLEQVERLEQVVDPLLLGQPAGEEDQWRVRREAEFRSNRGGIDRGRFLLVDPRVDHRQPIVGHAKRPIVIDHGVRVSHQPVAPASQPAVDESLGLPLPEIDGHLGRDHDRDPGQSSRDPPVGVGREDPGLDHVELSGLEEPDQPRRGPGDRA